MQAERDAAVKAMAAEKLTALNSAADERWKVLQLTSAVVQPPRALYGGIGKIVRRENARCRGQLCTHRQSRAAERVLSVRPHGASS